MPGRPAAAKSPTKYLNSKRRTIWHMSGTNKYVAKSEKGALVYNPRARYVKSPGGSERLVSNTKVRPPSAIRAKDTRRPRINRGMKRGTRAGVHAGNLPRLFGSPKSPKRRGRPPKPRMSPMNNFLPNPYLRKGRKNKGMARPHARGPRGPQKAKLFARLMAPLN